MTIKQQGGIFGRNPSFNDVDANSLNVDGTITSDGLTVDGTTSLEDVTVSLDDTTSADSMPALTPSGSELVVKNTNNSADYTGIRLTTRTSAAGSWVIANEFAGSYKGDLVFHARDGASSSADKITFTNAGSIKINTSGQGIDFSATSGTGTSELFSDYETGAWSPVAARFTGGAISATYNTQAGYYTKVGNLVTCSFYIDISSISQGSSLTYISGLPYAPARSYYDVGTTGNNTAFTTVDVVSMLAHTDSRLYFREAGNTSSNSSAAWAAGALSGTITYMTS